MVDTVSFVMQISKNCFHSNESASLHGILVLFGNQPEMEYIAYIHGCDCHEIKKKKEIAATRQIMEETHQENWSCGTETVHELINKID